MLCATCMGLKISITLLAGFIIISGSSRNTCEGFEVLFPLSSVKLNIPLGEQSLSILTKIPFGRFQVVHIANGSTAYGYQYILENNIDNHLMINKYNGEVYLTDNFQNLNQSKKFIITAQNEKLNHTKCAHMLLEVSPNNITEFCANLENLCYWHEAHYTVVEDNIGERIRPKRIGQLRPNGFKYLCPYRDIKYVMESKSDQFAIKDYSLYTKGLIDHETLKSASSSIISLNLNCMVKTSSSVIEEFRRKINVTVVDRNDNGPKLQDSKVFQFDLTNPHFKVNDTIGEKIIFLDNDTMETNTHQTYKIYNDTFDLLQPSCNAYETDHTGKRTSFISCQIVFARNGILSVSPYCVTLEASDSTIDSNVLKSAKANICIRTDLNKIHESDRPTALALRTYSGRHHNRKSSSIVSSEELLTENESFVGSGNNPLLTHPVSVVYPKDVYIHRTAMMWYRVTQPEDMLNSPRVQQQLRFSIGEDRSRAFGITDVAGIVYIRNVTALQNALESVYFVNVNWQDTHNRSFIINMRLLNGRPANATCEHKLKSRTQSCAQIKFKKYCTKFCGLATDGGSCQWRGTNSGFTRNYASCVPNSTFCPDNICDPLEELDPLNCPQDCAASNKIMGPHTTNDNKRGILSASGTCICEDNGKCSCAPLDDDESESKSKRNGKRRNGSKSVLNAAKLSNLSQSENITSQAAVMNNGLVCGASCISFVVICPLVLFIIVICFIVTHKNFSQKSENKTQTVKSPIDGDCDIKNGDLPLMSLESSFKFDACDTKWEVSRELLILDTVLGEGEFGKVIKGYATDIAGVPGVTTVAVKMLKSGANSVEYMALMSEFKLLQEVLHPNVIKLLGACTKGENPMIIIEYAHYGSLRSYLRLSRKIECAGVDFTDGIEAVTVKDILSFAWQICKGMTYLTEIKLVHRDLAARNVLLAEGKICKVSDFGLTRDVYEDDAYLKRSRDRVPVKWMAPESLADHVYTTKSDVWAFGVLAWELITLGASPYPGVPPQNLYHLLKSGYRMERPENCSEDIYAIVRSCWADDANSRPSFKYLGSQFEKFLGNNAKYIELETNAISNPLYCGETGEPANDFKISKLFESFGEPDSLEHLWRPPKMSYDTNDCINSHEHSSSATNNLQFLVPPGYDMPRPLIEASTTEQVLRYENDLRFVLNIQKTRRSGSITTPTAIGHYSVPVKRGRSYMDMTNKTLIPDNLDNNDVEKNISKNISFRFSSLLNLNE